MKKLKIFLLLSILLCFGFALSSEVHAQGSPKLFEVNEVLPPTTQLRIHFNGGVTAILKGMFGLKSDNDNFEFITEYDDQIFGFHDGEIYIDIWDNDEEIWISPFNGTTHNYMDIDTSSWSLSKRTISSVGDCQFTWEDLAPTPSGYSITFEENGGTSVTDLSDVTELPDPLPIPTKEGYTFVRWYYNSTFTQIANPEDPIESDVTLYAMWRSNNAKIFEEDDELPAGYIKISWDFTGYPISDSADFVILGDNDLNIVISEWDEDKIEMEINFDERFNLVTPGYTIITLTSPETITDLYNGNIYSSDDYYDYVDGAIFWEVLPPEYLGDYDDLYDGELLDIEEDYILPQSKVGIKLLYNNTGGTKSGTITYTFGTYGQIILTAQEDNLSTQVTSAEITYNFTNPNWDIYMIDDSLANQSFGSTRGILFAGVLLDFSWTTEEERTITDITIEGDLELDIIFTRILTEEELAYQEGYSDGYTTAREIFGWFDGDDWYNGIDAWNLGEEYGRELYGWYDSTTDEWLSVDDYVARYGPGNGTPPMGPNDFYNNFDKYFIPAMIIVFGGAIVLTILKVFKGRE